MSDINPPLNEKEKPATAPGRKSFILSVLINLALIIILAGPWVWASLAADRTDTPWHYLQTTFHSVFAREKGSWNAVHGHAPASSANE